MIRPISFIARQVKSVRECWLNQSVTECLAGSVVRLMDIGAAGEIQSRWRTISNCIDYIGFEPDERSRTKLLRANHGCAHYTILPNLVWGSDGNLNLHLCRKPQTSSAFTPNKSFLINFPDAARYDVMDKINLPTSRLDSCDVQDVDFIKIDVQGGELEVLSGASNLLSSTLGLEVEVEFNYLYQGQPLFGAINESLTKTGFEFIDFVTLCRWERTGFNGFGQIAFGDALYLRSPEFIAQQVISSALPTRKLKAYIAICLLYKKFDLVIVLENLLKTQDPKLSNFIRNYRPLQRLKQLDNFTRRLGTLVSRITAASGGYNLHMLP